MKTIKPGETITCPHCKGKRGKTALLFYWVNCHLCGGAGQMTIDKIIRIDEKRGDIQATFTVNLHNTRLVTKTDWLF